jgi:hypothetical protein
MSFACQSAAQDQESSSGPTSEWTGKYIPAFLRRYPFVDVGFVYCAAMMRDDSRLKGEANFCLTCSTS